MEPPGRHCWNNRFSAIMHSLDRRRQDPKKVEFGVAAPVRVGGINRSLCMYLTMKSFIGSRDGGVRRLSHGSPRKGFVDFLVVPDNMVNLKDVSSDSESEKQSSRKKKSLSTAKGGRASMDVDQLEDEGRQEEVPDPSDVASEEGEEEEYEIEAILEAKRGAFPGVSLCCFLLQSPVTY